MRKFINNKASQATPARKAVCLLTAAALVATMGFGTALAAGGSGDDTALEVSDKATQSEEEDAVQSPATSEQAEAVASTTDEAAVSASSAAEKPQRRGVSQLSDAQVGSIVWVKSGSTVYKNTSDSKGRSVILSYKIQVTNIETVGDTTWYKFDFVDLGNVFLPGYHYVKVQDTSATEPSDSSSDDISASCGSNVSLALSGAPNGSRAEVKTLAPRDYSSEAFDEIGSHKVAFAVDINIKDANGQEWQPNDGEGVAVSLDADKLGLKNGEKIGILHEHDGQLTNLGEYAVAGGKLTFETDGFSNFYGYTVDFKYDGTWHSIGGGSYIYLYELFAMLGIDRSASDVTNVTVSDESLISAEQVTAGEYADEKTWLVSSLAPFDTEELLTVTFDDGTSLSINVYDAQYTVLTGDVTLHGGDSIGGLNQEVTSITRDATITLTGGTVKVGNVVTVCNDATLTIKGHGTLQRDLDSLWTGSLFEVYGGGKLVIEGDMEEGGITIDGGAKWSSTQVDNSTRKTLSVTEGGNVTGAAIAVGVGGSNASRGSVDLTNVTMQNLYTKYTGKNEKPEAMSPAIYSTGSESDEKYSIVNMTNVMVTRCATMTDHSITLFNDSVANLKGCTFTDNYSGNRYAGTVKSGGPQWFSQLTMESCTASRNYSSGWGGVVLWAANSKCGSEESKALIKDCALTENTARWLGGALSNEAIMTVEGTTISGNTAMAGGGIASFPFTRTDDQTETSGEACGLTLGKGNKIEGNKAEATGNFKPFDVADGPFCGITATASGDDVTIESDQPQPTYSGGGGGIWCYMNKDKWTCSLKVGDGNTIQKNESKNAGGGVYVEQVAGKATTLSVVGATIEGNTAVNGGGVAVKAAKVQISSGSIESNTASKNGGGIYVESNFDSAADGVVTVSGTGSIKGNTAANGGGIYIDQGSLSVTGGVITGNKAQLGQGVSPDTTAKDADAGIGGGIYVKKGSFTLSGGGQGGEIGLHSNTADVAAADAYATGGDKTTLTLPDVKQMTLSGWTGEGNPEGWYADYMSDDSNYPSSLLGAANPGRYSFDALDKLEVGYDSILKSNKNAYYCLTIGTPQQGNGSLTITKSLMEGEKEYKAPEDQTFLFEVSKVNGDSSSSFLTVAVVVKKNESSATATIANLPYGTYSVRELSDWSWRYEQTGMTIAPKEGSAISGLTFTVNAQQPSWTAAVTNKLTNDKWLSGDCYCENWWKGLQEIAHAGGPEPIVSAGEGESSAVSEN